MLRIISTVTMTMLLAACSSRALPQGGVASASVSTPNAAHTDRLAARNVELQMELRDLQDQNDKLRTLIAKSRSLSVYGSTTRPIKPFQGGIETETQTSDAPPDSQTKHWGNITFYVIPLDAGVATAVPSK